MPYDLSPSDLSATTRAVAPLDLTVAGHFVYAGRVGGAEHMFYNLMQGIGDAGARLTLLCGALSHMDPAFVARLADSGARILERGGAGLRFVAEQRALFGADLRSDAILFPNYAVPPVLPRRLGRRLAVLHDLQYRHFRANFSQRKRLWLRLAHWHMIRRVDRLIVISEFVRRDAARHLGARFADRLTVIPNPVSWDRFDTSALPRPLPQPYLLSVSAQYAHKNVETLLRAFALLAPRHPELRLVLCGQDYASLHGVSGRRQPLAEQADALGIGDRLVVTGYVDDAALGQWYRCATAFAFPSVFEGFGMPPVEALGFGLPTVIASRTALPEVTRGLAHEVHDALSPDAWAATLDPVLAAPARYRPSADAVAALRDYYAPARIGRLYLDACAG